MRVSLGAVLRAGSVLLALLLVGPIASVAAKEAEIPITTKSADALKLFLQGRDKMEYWHTEEANKLFSQAVAADPDFAMGHLYKGFTSVKSADRQEALKKALALGPGTSEAEQLLISAGKAYYIDNDPVKGLSFYKKLAALFPNDKRAHLYLAGAYIGREEGDNAISEFAKSIAIDDTFAPAHEKLGYYYFDKGIFDKAEPHFKKLVALSPKEPNPYDCLGDLYRKMGRFDEAVNNYAKAVELDRTFAASKYKEGIALIFAGKYDGGRTAINKAMELELDPANRAGDMSGIARSYLYQGDERKALLAMDDAIRAFEEHRLAGTVVYAHLFKSMIHCNLKEFDEAEHEVAVARKANSSPDLLPAPRENNSLNFIFFDAWLLGARRDFESAFAKAAEFKTAVEARRDPVWTKYPLLLEAYIRLEKGEAAKADELFSKTSIDDPFFIYYAAVAKEKAGDKEGARKLFKKVADWNDDYFWYPFVRLKAKARV